MNWRTVRHIQSTDGKTESVECELILNFPTSHWNKKEESPVVKVKYYDYKVESGWWIDDAKTKWYTYPPHKSCEIYVNYLQRHPVIKFGSRFDKVTYEEFTLEYCKEQAIKIFVKRLQDILKQCK